MKILYITPFEPDYYQGGGRVCYLNLLSLLQAGYAVSYIGPHFQEDDELNYDGLAEKYFIEKHNFIDKIKSVFYFTNVFSLFLNDVLEKLDLSSFDSIFCESTRLDIFRRSDLTSSRVFTVVHNVECDYYKFNFHGVIGKLKYFSIRRIERSAIRSKNNKLIFFHEEDISKISLRYQYAPCDLAMLPVCIKGNTFEFPDKKEKLLLFVGSLGIKYNHEGIVKFIKQGMPELADFRLIIAGRNPNRELRSLVDSLPNVDLVDSPPEIEPFFLMRAIFLNPDMSGSGMKLKVAEALSFALPVVSTRLGANGYKCLDHNGGLVVEDIEDFPGAIKKVEKEYTKYSRDALLYFKREFSCDNHKDKLVKILEES